MDDQQDEQQLEVVPARRPNGTLLPGGPSIGGRSKNSLNRITKLVRDRMAAEIGEGRKIHPAEVLLEISNDSNEKTAVRMRAASFLLPYLMPMKHALEIDMPEPADEERIQKTKRMLATLWIEETS